MNAEQTLQHLRYQIVGRLHVGRLGRGDPLPSIRRTARELGTDHRTVAAAYRALAAEGLVEIRPGAGVYLAGHEDAAGVPGPPVAEWLGEVLLEGWRRGMTRAEVGRLVARVAGSRVRCVVVESNEDHMVALTGELDERFSLEVVPVLVSPGADDAAAIPRFALAGADLVVTSAFHAAVTRAAARPTGRPVVVLSIDQSFGDEVNRRLTGRQVTAVVADPRFSARARAYLDVTPHRGAVRFVLVDDLHAPGQPHVDLESDSVLVTRAARRRLGMPEYHLIPSGQPYLSPQSARALIAAIVELGLEEMDDFDSADGGAVGGG